MAQILRAIVVVAVLLLSTAAVRTAIEDSFFDNEESSSVVEQDGMVAVVTGAKTTAEESKEPESSNDMPKCPIEIAEKDDGDPKTGSCCKNGAKMFNRKRLEMTLHEAGRFMKQVFFMNNGCNFCQQTEKYFDVTNVEVHKFPSMKTNGTTPTTMDSIGTYADLTPRQQYSASGVPREPVIRPDGTFNDNDNQYVLFLYTKEDHNGAFSFTKTLCKRLECWAKMGYEVVMRRVASKAEAKGVLDKFPDKSIHHVVLSGHGSSSVLVWGNGMDGALSKGSLGTHKFLMKLRKKLKIRGTVLLDACLNAQDRWFGLQNLFEYVASKLPGRKVTASKVSLSDDMWTKVQKAQSEDDAQRVMAADAEVDVDEQCLAGDQVQFITQSGDDATAIRRAGRPNCKELTSLPQILGNGDDEKGFDSCLTRCRSKCEDVFEKETESLIKWPGSKKESRWPSSWKNEVTLKDDVAAQKEIAEKDLNPCRFGQKMVCKIVKKQSGQ